MYQINYNRSCKDLEVIKLLFTEEEISDVLTYGIRVDRNFTTKNLARMTAYITAGEVSPLRMEFFLTHEESPINENFTLDLGNPTEEETWVMIGESVFHTKLYRVSEYSSVAWDGQFYRPASLIKIEDGTFKLKEGLFAIGKYKNRYYSDSNYEPNLTFISEIPILQWEKRDRGEFNLPKGRISVIIGEFFVSRKGTKSFKVKKDGRHILIRDSWGGASSSYGGNTLPKEGALYYRRASSNGGGKGCDYAVYPREWKYALSEEDI